MVHMNAGAGARFGGSRKSTGAEFALRVNERETSAAQRRRASFATARVNRRATNR